MIIRRKKNIYGHKICIILEKFTCFHCRHVYVNDRLYISSISYNSQKNDEILKEKSIV